jgi:hypothetical protein
VGTEVPECRSGARHLFVPPARTGRKGRKLSSAFVQVEASYRLGMRGRSESVEPKHDGPAASGTSVG